MSDLRRLTRVLLLSSSFGVVSLSLCLTGCDGGSPKTLPPGESLEDKAKAAPKGVVPLKKMDFSEGIPKKEGIPQKR